MMYSQGDVLLVSLPFTDLTSQKRRPVLVLSKNEYNNATEDLIVAAITSKIDAKPYVVVFTDNDMATGSLKVDSCIRIDKIYTLSQDIIPKYFGRVKLNIIEQVKRQVLEIIGGY